jgi:hypothetical protein
MDYKEKYEIALERAKSLVGTKEIDKTDFEYIFPELRESEDEEKRKRVIECLKLSLKGAEDQNDAGCDRTRDIDALKWGIAYLEKQKSVPALDRGDEIILKAICEELQSAPGWVERIEGWYRLAKDAQQPAEWSDEDEKMLHIVITDINYAQKNFSYSKLVPYGKKVDWLRAFRERSKSLEPQPKQEWTGYSGIIIDKTEYPELTDAEFAILRGFARVTGCSHFPITIVKETAQDFLAHLVMISEINMQRK